jgi:NAD(P) transhydrogenase subunit alpha
LDITTTLVHRRESPVLIIKEQIDKRNNGAEIIDLAAAQGGIWELSKINKVPLKNGVKIIGTTISPESLSTYAIGNILAERV